MRSPASTQAYKPLKRFFVTLPNIFDSFPIEVPIQDEALCHHLRNVIRAKPGEIIVVVDDAREVTYQAVITAIQKSSLTLQLEQLHQAPPDMIPPVTLAAALVKEQRWDWLLQKATELGARIIQPLMSEYSVVRLDAGEIPKKLERWQTLLRNAAEQSEGMFIPQILPPLTINNYLKQLSPSALHLLLKERGAARSPMKAVLPQHENCKGIVLAIGPEGGWSDAEIDAFEQAGFQGVSLGNRILRSETAAIVALSAIIYETELPLQP